MNHSAFASLALALVVVHGCSSKKSSDDVKPTEAEAPANAKPDLASDSAATIVRPNLGGAPGEGPGELRFAIVAVHKAQKPVETPPFHAAGGEWTFVDAQAGDAKFSFGFVAQPLEGVPFERAMARIAAADRSSASELVTGLAAAFQAPPPAPSESTLERKPLEMPGAVLGRDMQRRVDGGFSGTGGGWISSKWTIERDDDSVEFYVDLNLNEKRGAFSEKDSGYRELLIKWLGESL